MRVEEPDLNKQQDMVSNNFRKKRRGWKKRVKKKDEQNCSKQLKPGTKNVIKCLDWKHKNTLICQKKKTN